MNKKLMEEMYISNFILWLTQKIVEQNIKKDILSELPISNFIIKNINSKKNYLGFYKNNSCFNIPIIKLNRKCIVQSAKETNIKLYDIILTTILHELGHCIQQLKDKWFDEEEAENFAYMYWDWGILEKFWEKKV